MLTPLDPDAVLPESNSKVVSLSSPAGSVRVASMSQSVAYVSERVHTGHSDAHGPATGNGHRLGRQVLAAAVSAALVRPQSCHPDWVRARAVSS
jgi:hypothetical protein